MRDMDAPAWHEHHKAFSDTIDAGLSKVKELGRLFFREGPVPAGLATGLVVAGLVSLSAPA